MSFLSNFSTKIKPIIKPLRNVRTISIRIKQIIKPRPIPMSYTSFENTTTTEKYKESPLIIIHSLFGAKGNWRSVADKIQNQSDPSRKVFAVDMRNHGDSPHVMGQSYEEVEMDIKYFMKSHGIHKACLMGHSFGGRAVMYFALRNPDLVDKLIIVDITPVQRRIKSPVFNGAITTLTILHTIHFDSHKSLSFVRKDVDQQLARYITDKKFREFLLTNLVKKNDKTYGWRINLPVLVADYHKIASFPNLSNYLYRGPTLFVKGEKSNYFLNEDLTETKILFPNLIFHVVDDAGHWVHWENRDLFLNYVIGFLNE